MRSHINMNTLFFLVFLLSNVALAADTELELSIWPVYGENQVVLVGNTNLPDGTRLMIELSRPNFHDADDRVIVHNGSFESKAFSRPGRSLVGRFNLDIISLFSDSWQYHSVVDNLRNFYGALITDNQLHARTELHITPEDAGLNVERVTTSFYDRVSVDRSCCEKVREFSEHIIQTHRSGGNVRNEFPVSSYPLEYEIINFVSSRLIIQDTDLVSLYTFNACMDRLFQACRIYSHSP